MYKYTVYALQNKQNKKILVDMTYSLDKPICLKNLMLNDIINGDSTKNDFVMYVLGENLKYSEARNLMISKIIFYESYKPEFGYNDLNSKLKVSIKPKILYGEPTMEDTKWKKF